MKTFFVGFQEEAKQLSAWDGTGTVKLRACAELDQMAHEIPSYGDIPLQCNPGNKRGGMYPSCWEGGT